MSYLHDDDGRRIAAQLEREHSNWMVIFGAYTRQFIAFPRFQRQRPAFLVARYPDALADRMDRTERELHISRPEKRDYPMGNDADETRKE